MAKYLKLGSRGAKVEALQSDLNMLGYELIEDGIFGRGTDAAVKNFQGKHELYVDGIVGHFTEMTIFNTLNNVEIIYPHTEHFTYLDFISSGDVAAKTNGIPRKYWANLQTLMERLETVTAAMNGAEIIVRSGYRSPEYNRKVGGAKYSQHLYAKAADIYIKDHAVKCSDLANRIYFDDDLKGLFGGYGLGSDTNVHLDIRKRSNPLKPAIWWYGKKSWKEWR